MAIIYWLLGLKDVGSIETVTAWQWYVGAPLALLAIIVVVALGVIAAGLNVVSRSPLPIHTRTVLILVRLAGFAILLAMLCQLELRMNMDRNVRPKVAVVSDGSGSMGLTDMDGETRLAAAKKFNEEHLASLSSSFDLVQYHCNWKLHPGDVGEQATGMTRLVQSLSDLSGRENDLQAIIMLTDGNDTLGDLGNLVAPALASRNLPVFPVIFGNKDKAPRTEVEISSGPYVRLHDELRFNATIRSHGQDEQTVTVHLYEDDNKEPIRSKENVRLGKKPVSVRFLTKAEVVGHHKYRIVVEGSRAGLVTTQTEVAEHDVQVIDAKIHVLYVDIPRDERKILGHHLAVDPVVDLATLTLMPKGGWYATGQMRHDNAGDGLPDAEEDMYEYDVIIFGDIPRTYFHAGDVTEAKMTRLSDFVRRRGGGLITIGGRTVYSAGLYQDSKLADLLPFELEATDEPQIDGEFSIRPTALGLSHQLFQFDLDTERNRDIVFDFPTLDGCNRVGDVKPGASLLAFRESEEEAIIPVIAVHNVGKGQVMSMTCDTTWRWEMMRELESEDHYRRFWGSAVRSLAPDPRIRPRKPQILKSQSTVAVGQHVTMSTRLVDKYYKPLRNAKIEVLVESPSHRKINQKRIEEAKEAESEEEVARVGTRIFPVDGRQAPGLYQYEFPVNEDGEWWVTTTYENVTEDVETVVERFVAGESPEEFDDPRAKVDLMQNIADITGGELLMAGDDPDSLIKKLELTTTQTTQIAAIPIWNLPVTMVLLIALVGLDCFLRKKRGMV